MQTSRLDRSRSWRRSSYCSNRAMDRCTWSGVSQAPGGIADGRFPSSSSSAAWAAASSPTGGCRRGVQRLLVPGIWQLAKMTIGICN